VQVECAAKFRILFSKTGYIRGISPKKCGDPLSFSSDNIFSGGCLFKNFPASVFRNAQAFTPQYGTRSANACLQNGKIQGRF
jgi:hypothetical protein